MSLIENIQREDLNPLEEAQGLQRLVTEFGLTHETAAQAVGRSRSAASNLLRLLNLAEPAQAMLMAGDIDMGHARALLSLDRGTQITAANQIAAKKMSVREAEALVKKLAAEFSSTPSPRRAATPRSRATCSGSRRNWPTCSRPRSRSASRSAASAAARWRRAASWPSTSARSTRSTA